MYLIIPPHGTNDYLFVMEPLFQKGEETFYCRLKIQEIEDNGKLCIVMKNFLKGAGDDISSPGVAPYLVEIDDIHTLDKSEKASLLKMGFDRFKELYNLITPEKFDFIDETEFVDEKIFYTERELDIDAWEKKYGIV